MLKKITVLAIGIVLLALVPTPAQGGSSVIARIPVRFGVQGLAINAQTRRGYVVDFFDVSVFDLDSNSLLGTLPGLTLEKTVAVDEARNRVYVTDLHGLGIYDGVGQVLGFVGLGSDPRGIAVDPTTGTVYVADRLDSTLSVISGTSVVRTLPVGLNPLSVAVDPDLHRVYVSNTVSNSVSVIDSQALRVLSTIEGVESPRGITVDPITHRVFVTNFDMGWMTVIDPHAMRISNRIWLRHSTDAGCCPGFVALDPALSHLHVDSGGYVTTIDTTTETIARIGEDLFQSGYMAADPTTSRLYVADQARNEVTVFSEPGRAGAVAVIATSDGPASTYQGKRWTNGSWTVRLVCRTACSQIEFAIGEDELQPYAEPLTFADEGEYVLSYRANGSTAEDRGLRTLTLVVDRTPPDGAAFGEATEASQDGWTRGWWRVGFTCHDTRRPEEITCLPISSIDDSEYRSRSGVRTLYDEGLHTVRYWLEDPAGNVAPEQDKLLGIDRHPAGTELESQAIGPSFGRWARDGWRITLNCTDPEYGSPPGASGCGLLEYAIDGGDIQTYEGPFEIREEGEHTIRFRSTDVAGNVETFSETSVSVDQTPPDTRADNSSTREDDGRWTNGDWIIALACSDPPSGTPTTASGCDGSVYSVGTGPSSNYEGPFRLTREGSHIVTYASLDRVTNGESDHTVILGIDRKLPIGSMITPDGTVFASAGPVALDAAVGDPLLEDLTPGSGVPDLCFDVARIRAGANPESVGCAAAAGQGAGTAWHASMRLDPGVYRVTPRFADRAGNPGAPASIAIIVQSLP